MKKLLAKDFYQEKIPELKKKVKEGSKLVIITDGKDDASKIYIKQKVKLANELGIKVYIDTIDDTEDEVIQNIHRYNELGVPTIIQSPLSNGMDEERLMNEIDVSLDIDGLTNDSLANCLVNGNLKEGFSSCTPEGIIELLKFYDIDLEGKNVLLLGRSKIVGIPMIGLLLHENANVKIEHSYTKKTDLKNDLKKFDVIITQVGIPNFFGISDVKNDAIIVDVSMNRNNEGKLCGDFDHRWVESTDIQYTPVPGGVGPMTVYELIKHTIECQR